MIATLSLTIFIEGAVVLGYSIRRKKPVLPILLTSAFANLVTQSLLWLGLNLFFRHYLVTLFFTEILIWMVESVLLYCFPANQLGFKESVLLSLMMNLASFGLGWLLPI